MAKVNTLADQEVLSVVETVIDNHYPELKEAGVRVGVIMVEPNKKEGGIPTAPAVRNHGAEAPAKVRLVGPKEHLINENDVMIDVDQDYWDSGSELQQAAVIDHALAYVNVKRKGEDIVYRDDSRPQLSRNEPDWHIWGFRNVFERNREASFEAESLEKALHAEGNQLMFEFAIGGNTKKRKKAAAA